jgi:hypothetical protein
MTTLINYSHFEEQKRKAKQEKNARRKLLTYVKCENSSCPNLTPPTVKFCGSCAVHLKECTGPCGKCILRVEKWSECKMISEIKQNPTHKCGIFRCINMIPTTEKICKCCIAKKEELFEKLEKHYGDFEPDVALVMTIHNYYGDYQLVERNKRKYYVTEVTVPIFKSANEQLQSLQGATHTTKPIKITKYNLRRLALSLNFYINRNWNKFQENHTSIIKMKIIDDNPRKYDFDLFSFLYGTRMFP